MIDKIKSPALHRNAIRLLDSNQYIFKVDPKASKTEVKRWIEAVFGVQIIGINSKCQAYKKKRMGPRIGYSVRYKQMIIRLKPEDSISPVLSKKIKNSITKQ